MTISIPLQKALSLQNIRINVPSTFTVGISTESGIMTAAAERLLHLGQMQVEEMAKEIIFGQLRLTVASLTIEQINQDRERFLEAILLKYQAQAEGVRQVLESKAAGYLQLVEGCNGDAKFAATLLMTEKIEEIVQLQVETIRNIKIDKVTVWDAASSGQDKTATANFLSGMVKSLPPLHDVAGMAGIDLPEYLGTIAEQELAQTVELADEQNGPGPV